MTDVAPVLSLDDNDVPQSAVFLVQTLFHNSGGFLQRGTRKSELKQMSLELWECNLKWRARIDESWRPQNVNLAPEKFHWEHFLRTSLMRTSLALQLEFELQKVPYFVMVKIGKKSRVLPWGFSASSWRQSWRQWWRPGGQSSSRRPRWLSARRGRSGIRPQHTYAGPCGCKENEIWVRKENRRSEGWKIYCQSFVVVILLILWKNFTLVWDTPFLIARFFVTCVFVHIWVTLWLNYKVHDIRAYFV